MTDDGRKTETKSVQAIRGLESRTIAKQEQDGWHLVTQKPGKLRTELTFERERPPLPKKALIGRAAALVAVAVIITIGVVTDKDEPTAAAPAANSATAPASTTEAPSPVTSKSPSAGTQLVTVKNNEDLAALVKLADNCDDSVEDFADKYEDQEIQFDGAVAAIAPHDDYKTRYDILVVPGEANDDVQYGPTFQYKDVSLINDLGWTGSKVPNSLRVKTKLRLTATVGEYDTDSCLFQLDPVATQAR